MHLFFPRGSFNAIVTKSNPHLPIATHTGPNHHQLPAHLDPPAHSRSPPTPPPDHSDIQVHLLPRFNAPFGYVTSVSQLTPRSYCQVSFRTPIHVSVITEHIVASGRCGLWKECDRVHSEFPAIVGAWHDHCPVRVDLSTRLWASQAKQPSQAEQSSSLGVSPRGRRTNTDTDGSAARPRRLDPDRGGLAQHGRNAAAQGSARRVTFEAAQ